MRRRPPRGPSGLRKGVQIRAAENIIISLYSDRGIGEEESMNGEREGMTNQIPSCRLSSVTQLVMGCKHEQDFLLMRHLECILIARFILLQWSVYVVDVENNGGGQGEGWLSVYI